MSINRVDVGAPPNERRSWVKVKEVCFLKECGSATLRSTEQIRSINRVDVGAPPNGRRSWELTEVCFHGFADLPRERGEKVVSPEFTCLGNKWHLEIYPGGDEDCAEGLVAVFLGRSSVNSSDRIDVEVCLALKDSARTDYHTETFESEYDYCGKTNFAKRSRIMNALVEGTLTIEVCMTTTAATDASAPFVPQNPLRQNILKKFLDRESADILFEVVGEDRPGGEGPKRAKTTSVTTFPAHSLILQDGASTLGELCTPGKGGPTTVRIAGVKPAVFRLLLLHSYGGDLTDDDLKDHARDLIDAADKYGVATLKLAAEARYVESTALTVDNFLDNLQYAQAKNCALLKEAVVDFILARKEDLLGASFEDFPGDAVRDLLAAMARGEGDGGAGDGGDYRRMRVGALRRLLDEKGLDVDGSREAMIARLEECSPVPPRK